MRGALAQQVCELRQHLQIIMLQHSTHSAIGLIAHPARYTQFPRPLRGVVAVTHALHAPIRHDLQVCIYPAYCLRSYHHASRPPSMNVSGSA